MGLKIALIKKERNWLSPSINGIRISEMCSGKRRQGEFCIFFNPRFEVNKEWFLEQFHVEKTLKLNSFNQHFEDILYRSFDGS